MLLTELVPGHRQHFWVGPSRRSPCWSVINPPNEGVTRETGERPFLFLFHLNNDPLQGAAWEGCVTTEPHCFVPWENTGGVLIASHAALCPLPVKALRWNRGDAFLEHVLKLPAVCCNVAHSKTKTFSSSEVHLWAPRTSYLWQGGFSTVQRRDDLQHRLYLKPRKVNTNVCDCARFAPGL